MGWPARPWPEAIPRYVTPRNPDRQTLGPQVAEVSRALGFEPMPWQCDNWDTQYEYVEVNGCKKLWYRTVRLTVPRQSAKTTGTLVRHCHRAVYAEENGWLRPGDRTVSAFTMQNQKAAATKMTETWHPILEASQWAKERFREKGGLVKSNGSEGVRWRNGARIGVFPPNMKGGHGDVLDLVDIDEAWSLPDDRAEQGARPATITRLSPQIVVQSTQGTVDFSYFSDLCDDGRERATSGTDGHIYYLEYACGPEDDINNPEHWPRWMPALGYTIDIDAVALEQEAMEPEEFLRAYGNVRSGGRLNQIIPAAAWTNCYAPKSFRSGNVWMAVDASPGLGGNGRSATIAIASYREDKIAVEVIKHAPGIMWVPDAIGEVTRQHKVQQLWIDPTGPIGSIVNDIKQRSMATLQVTDARAMVNACGRFHQAVLDAKIEHRAQDMLNAAVEGAAKRTLEDGWAWKRAASSSDISPLVAVTLAHWGAALQGERGLILMQTAGAA